MTRRTRTHSTLLRRGLVGLAVVGVGIVPAACGSDSDDTDVTVPDVSIDVSTPDSILAPGDTTSLGTDSSNTSMGTTMDQTTDTVMSGSDGTASNDDSTTP